MVAGLWVLAVLLVIGLAIILLLRGPMRRMRQTAEFERARRFFHTQRERLEAKFFQIASDSGKPRDLRWSECDFEDSVTYARDRRSGQLCAFVAVTIGFEAVEGGMMEGVEAVANRKAATAVFRYDGAHWQTDGRAVFNLSPRQTIDHFRESLVCVGEEVR